MLTLAEAETRLQKIKKLYTEALPLDYLPHQLIVGPTGTGKSNLANLLALNLVKQGYAVTLAAPHDEFGRNFLSELYFTYGRTILKRLIVNDTRDMAKVVMQQFVRVSSATNPLDRMLENDLFAGAFLDTVARRRKDITDIAEKPVLEKYTKLAAKLAQNQSEWFPEWWLPYAFVPKHPIHGYLVGHCTDGEVRREFAMFRQFPVREQLSILDPIFRLLSAVLLSPPIIARTSKPVTFNKRAHLNNGGITVILGGASDDATSVIIGSDFQETMFLAKQGLARPVAYIVDELLNFKLCGHFESRILSTIRWKNVTCIFITQSFDFPSDEIRNNVLQNTDHVWLRQGTKEMATYAAEDMLGALDEFKIHHIDKTTRQVHIGFDEVLRTFKGKTKHPEQGIIENEREGLSMIPRYGEHVEERPVYQPATEQLIWLAQKIQRQPVGHCWFRKQNQTPFPKQIPLLPDSWGVPGAKEQKVTECLSLLKQSPIYEVPELRMPEGPTTPMRKNATKRPGNS